MNSFFALFLLLLHAERGRGYERGKQKNDEAGKTRSKIYLSFSSHPFFYVSRSLALFKEGGGDAKGVRSEAREAGGWRGCDQSVVARQSVFFFKEVLWVKKNVEKRKGKSRRNKIEIQATSLCFCLRNPVPFLFFFPFGGRGGGGGGRGGNGEGIREARLPFRC